MFFLCVSAWCPRNDTVHTRVPHQEEDKHTSPVDTHFLSLHSVMQICVYTFRYHSNQTVTTTGKLNVYSVQHKQMKPALFISHWKISKNNAVIHYRRRKKNGTNAQRTELLLVLRRVLARVHCASARTTTASYVETAETKALRAAPNNLFNINCVLGTSQLLHSA